MGTTIGTKTEAFGLILDLGSIKPLSYEDGPATYFRP